MAKCSNCGTKLGCSCKKRTASDGRSCCANCISKYEQSLQKIKSSSSIAPGVIINATAIQKD